MGGPFEIMQQAHALAEQGREAEAIALIDGGVAKGNPFAFFMLADWRLRGVLGPRDPAEARSLFRRAGDAGMPTANLFYTNLLASGIGGQADWQGALARLRRE